MKVGDERPASFPYVGTYAVDTVLKITAVPTDGYTFTGWSGSSQETAAAISVTMSCSKYLVANFQPAVDTVNADKPLLAFPVWLGIIIVLVVLGGFIGFLKLHSRH